MNLEQLYQKAQKDCYYRQELLDKTYLEGAGRFVSKVVYIPPITSKFTHQEDFLEVSSYKMCTRASWFSREWGWKRFKSQILIFDSAFSMSYAYFLSALVDHEGYHAQEFFQDPDQIRIEHLHGCFEKAIRKAEREIRALDNQLRSAQKRGLTAEEVSNLEKLMAEHQTIIVNEKGLAREF
jgi:hypothetical protein